MFAQLSTPAGWLEYLVVSSPVLLALGAFAAFYVVSTSRGDSGEGQ